MRRTPDERSKWSNAVPIACVLAHQSTVRTPRAARVGRPSLICLMKHLLLLMLLPPLSAQADWKLVDAARERTRHSVVYDSSYRAIEYPGGDVPNNIGVCTDLVIRSLRALEVDLQKLVHEDMSQDFSAYPQSWGLNKPDRNIDHRRVPNLERFFERKGQSLGASEDPAVFKPGDLVTWRLGGRIPHIGIVSDRVVPSTRRYYVIHNIGQGPKEEDALFRYPLYGHYRYPKDN